MTRQRRARRGVASVELAIVSILFLVPMLIGLWEAGRLIQVQQIVCNSARAGARLAAQGYTINSSGAATQIQTSSGTPNVTSTVYQYLYAAGLTNLQAGDVTVTFTFLGPNTSGVTPSDPYLGSKNEPFSVYVSIPWSKVQLVNLGILRPTTVNYTATWYMLVDDPFTVDTSIPTW